MYGDEMPTCLEVAFRPTSEMVFMGIELAIFFYIFGTDYDPKEILVPNEHCCGSQEALMTLCSKNWVGDNILNLVASMLMKHAAVTVKGNKWFLPTTFAQIALQQRHISVGTMEYIKTNFMGKVEDLSKIYIPNNVKDHWFLVVVEKSRGLITYLDSLKCSKQRLERMKAIYDVISFLENLLLDDWFYQSDTTERSMVSKFKFQEPEVPQQDAQSHSVIYGGVVPYRWSTNTAE
ncbi:uncharacterized protein LOC107639690 isoform X3 [Arachis ipaensis]|uniref:uncharacterized protein LOC107639690 isoform X3 n=1 Tax=Arachis ipaensis TaxID=130454 RepID=UPI0007AFBF12|nr:uncharacterized protein LOC107639690 isoform X3 [Arachis ipaensis]XP_029148004.1 uncharacterized protein LOC112743701 isoform X3 [Arachis hypogaea]